MFSIAPPRTFARARSCARSGIHRAKIFFAKIAVMGALSDASARKTRESVPK
jgi:hypothetical protein